MIALATVMAVLLNSPLLKARPLYRFAFFAPVVVGEVAYALVAKAPADTTESRELDRAASKLARSLY